MPASSNNDGSPETFLLSNSLAGYARFKRGPDRGTGELQTSIVSYRKKLRSSPDSALQVDLVSAIHIGDKEYYAALQKELDSYDCVLYESLEKGENPTTEGSRWSWFNFNFLALYLQLRMVQIILSLDDQERINYEAESWYHADIDYKTFERLESQREKGESFWKLAMLPVTPLIGFLLCNGGEVVGALSRLDSVAAIKVFLAKLLTSKFNQWTADEEEKSVLIGERNRVAIEALKRAMDEKGHNNSKIAIFYGASHMRDMGRRLRVELDLLPSRGVRWITAWSIQKASGWTLNRCLTLALFLAFFGLSFAVALLFCKIISGFSLYFVSRIADYVSQYLV